MTLAKFAKRYRVDDPDSFRIKDWDPGDTNNLDIEKKEAKDLLEEGVKRLSELQERLYAQDRWAVLLIFQAMDAAGKDSVIKHVMKGVNPQGCDVHSFKQPSQEELDHDFMWRTSRRLPERGRIGTLVGAADFPGDGRGGQGQCHQARHEGRESARLRCAFLQAAKSGRT